MKGGYQRMTTTTNDPRQVFKFMHLACATTLLLAPSIAFAYIDPNAGGVLFQLLMPLFAAIAGGWLFLRRWIAACFVKLWRKLTGSNPK